jgi:hypothetical protein
VVRLIESGRWAHEPRERERKEMKKYRSILEIEREIHKGFCGELQLQASLL